MARVTTRTTTLQTGIDDKTMTFVVVSDTDFPSAPFYILVDSEYMYVTRIVDLTFSVERGQLNSTAAAHSAGATVTSVISTTLGGVTLGG